MGEPTQNQPDQISQGHAGKLRSLVSGLVKGHLDEHPLQKAAVEWFKSEGRDVKNGRVLFSVLAIGLMAACWWVTHRVDNKIAEAEMSATNGIHTAEAKGLNDKIEQLKTDKVELRQQSDKFELQAQNDRNALAPWVQLAKSQFSDASVSNGLDRLFQHVAAMESRQPRFDLQLNGLEVTNGMVIELPTTRQIDMIVFNRGEDTASGVTIELMMPIATTNVVYSDHWRSFPGYRFLNVTHNKPQKLEGVSSWMCTSEHRIPWNDAFSASPFIISTNSSKSFVTQEMLEHLGFVVTATAEKNYVYPMLPMQIDIFSDNSKRQTLKVLLSY
jgi:hypothetical protein